MSDIPIGSPPVPPGRHAAPQGWYPDPVDRSRERYWDGWSWSRNTREADNPAGYQQGWHQHIPQPGAYPHDPYQHGTHQQSQPPNYPSDPYQRAPYPQRPQQPAAGSSGAVPMTADGVPIAGWGWRFLSGLLDLMIVSIVADIFSIPILIKMLPVLQQYFAAVLAAYQRGETAPTLSPTALFSGTDQILITVISLVVGMLYFGLFWRFKAATPGQLLCGLRIVPTDHGHNTDLLPWPMAIVRAMTWWVPIAVSNVLLIFALINVLFPLGNVKRQAIHDLAAKTQIVKIR